MVHIPISGYRVLLKRARSHLFRSTALILLIMIKNETLNKTGYFFITLGKRVGVQLLDWYEKIFQGRCRVSKILL